MYNIKYKFSLAQSTYKDLKYVFFGVIATAIKSTYEDFIKKKDRVYTILLFVLSQL